MVIETKMVGRRTPFERRPVVIPEATPTLEGLLTHLVRQEVDAYTQRQDQVGVLRVLTERELQDAATTGRARTAPQDRALPVSPEDAVRTALQAFRDGLYYVFVDEAQVTDLAQTVHLKPDSVLLLLRLTALAGG